MKKKQKSSRCEHSCRDCKGYALGGIAMNRAEQAEKTTKALYGGASALGVTDPEFAAIKERLIYGEVYAEEKLSARLRELVILVVATTNQTMNEVKRHTAAALACGVKPEEIKEAVYHCAPYIGLPRTLNALSCINEVLPEAKQ